MSTPSQENPPPEQSQEYPGRTGEMDPQPRDEMRGYEGRGLLAGKRTLVTGGDSGIGRAVAVAFAKEGADVAIAYLSEQEDEDAQHTADLIKEAGQRCVTIRGDLAEEANCQRAVYQTVHELGGLDILVNNVATQQPVSRPRWTAASTLEGVSQPLAARSPAARSCRFAPMPPLVDLGLLDSAVVTVRWPDAASEADSVEHVVPFLPLVLGHDPGARRRR